MTARLTPIHFLIAATAIAGPAERETARQKAAAAIKQNLPKSAAEALAPIYADAIKDGAWGEALEALCEHTNNIAGSGTVENPEAYRIGRFETALKEAPPRFKPVIQAILACAYRDYLDSHWYKLASRTEIAAAANTPLVLESATAGQLVARIDSLYRAALTEESALRDTPLSVYARVIAKGNVSAARRPTLFDFLTHEALDFHTTGRRLVAVPSDAIILRAETPALGTVDEFLAWRPAGRDTDPVARAAALLQRRLSVHDRESEAFADADLARITWAMNAVTGDRAAERGRALLRSFAQNHASNPIAAEARAKLAESLETADRLREAHDTALAGEKAFPESVGGKNCAEIRARIERPTITITGERVWNAPWPRLSVNYKNAKSVRFRIVKSDWKKFLERDRGRPEWLSEKEKAEIHASPTEREWTAALPPTPDFQERTERVPVPEDLAPGFYFLIATDGADWSGKTAPVLYSDFQVSGLAVTVTPGEGAVTGRIHDAMTGEPVPDATVEGWYLNRVGDREPVSPVKSDASGAFSMGTPKSRAVLLLATAPNGHALASMSEYVGRNPRRPASEHNRVAWFTDRAVYRPGQTIRFKGTVIRADFENQKFRPIGERRVNVALDDANGKEVERVQVTTNAYGSFEGAFTAPRDRLPGRYQIHTLGSENGRQTLLIEEYKRPTFEVALETPAPGATLDGPVILSGKATTYTGTPAGDAKVTWRVSRTTRAPRWCHWFNPEPPREIASGQSRTDGRGAFSVQFKAEAPEGRITDGLVHSYTVHTDVTDAGGETRSASRIITLGRTDFVAEIDAADSGDIAVSLKSPDGVARPGVAGSVILKKLKEPAYVHRTTPEIERWRISYKRAAEAAAETDDGDETRDLTHADLSDPRRWETGETVATLPFTTGADGTITLKSGTLPAGHYRALLETTDRTGKPVKARTLLRRLPESGDKLGLKVPFLTTADRTEAKPGDTLKVVWGTGYDSGRAVVEVLRPGVPPKIFWTEAGKTRREITVPLTETDRGSVAVRVSQVRENRLYRAEHVVTIPHDDKRLAVAWTKFTDKLTPGAPVTWAARVTGPDGTPVSAEIAATLYDGSLDPFMKLTWPSDFGLWQDRRPWLPLAEFLNSAKTFNHDKGDYPETVPNAPSILYPEWNALVGVGKGLWSGASGDVMYSSRPQSLARSGGFAESRAPAAMAMKADSITATGDTARAPATPGPAVDLDAVKPRSKLDETAFWFPRVETNKDGYATFSFTAPEALTRWRCLLFAHDKTLRTGLLESSAVTALDLMVKPNAPRFLREGDIAELPVRVINRTDKPITGTARLAFSDLDSGTTRDAALGNTSPDKPFTVAAHTSVTLGWKVTVPDGEKFLRYTIKAADAAGAGDGETGAIPVLPRRIRVSESVAGTVMGPGETTVTLPALAASASSATLRPQTYTVQTVARPAWYAVQALPYLMEYPHECSEQLFHRFYANALAASITAKSPAIRETFDRWRGTPALDSPLEKNEEIKGVALAETPWVREAAGDAARRRRVALLFDAPAMKASGDAALAKLRDRRAADGGWAWFPGARESSPWVTRTIVLGLGRLRELGAADHAAFAKPALPVLDKWMRDRHELFLRHPELLKSWIIDDETSHHLHARALFLKDTPVDEKARPALTYFLDKARADWGKLDLASQARLALCLAAYGDTTTPAAIVASLRERAITDPARGMRWNSGRSAAFWRPWVAPVETQALLTEVFDVVAKDAAAADACRAALLDMKRTTDWGTTTATAEACHALLMRGESWLAGTAPLTVTAGTRTLKADTIEPGTGATEVRLTGGDITSDLAVVKAAKSDAGPAWVSAHWSYFEDAAKVKPSAGTGLIVKQQLFKKILTVNGPELLPLTEGRAAVGDEIVVRVTLSTDRDLDFVHLKTARPASLEPGVTTSGHRWNAALSWYEAVRDTATDRFIEHLPTGTHVFEFSARADRRGVCRGGITEARCLYAPDFAAHTEAPTLTTE